MDYKKYFKNKRITVMGLGLLGRGLRDTIFLAECGADLVVTDLRTKEELETSLLELKKYKNIKYKLGGHDFSDFENKDLILKAAGVPDDSPYLKHARKQKIPIEMDASLFAKLSPGVKIVGITGTRGKTTTTLIIFNILSEYFKNKKSKVYLAGNIRDGATLPLLSKVKKGDVVVLELDSWQLQGFGESKLSPKISVFTNFYPDHLNYYKGNLNKYFGDKANIFKYQTNKDFLIVGHRVAQRVISGKWSIKSKIRKSKTSSIPQNWKIIIPGEHNRENIACAVEVSKLFKISQKIVQKVVERFHGVEGRLQFLKECRGVKIWNDNNSTTPKATIVALEAISHASKKDIILILGGADKGISLTELVKEINQYCKSVVLLPGSGSLKLRDLISKLKVPVIDVLDLKSGILEALGMGLKGDQILFSPGFASFGLFKNEYDRNDQFMEIIKGLK